MGNAQRPRTGGAGEIGSARQLTAWQLKGASRGRGISAEWLAGWAPERYPPRSSVLLTHSLQGLLAQTAVLKLNGGLGTSTGPTSTTALSPYCLPQQPATF